MILLIWPWMYSSCSFWCVFVRSPWAFLKLCSLAFVGFLLNKDAVFILSRFPLTTITSHGTLYLALGLIGMHLVPVSIWAVTNFSYSSFGVCFSDAFRKILNLFLHIDCLLIVYWLFIDCLYHHWQVKNSHIVKFCLFLISA